MGCGGCELWNPRKGIRYCYAGVLTERYKGGSGWPEAFDRPAVFPYRLAQARRWPDLTGQARERKTWLSGYPRFVFAGDMGDTWTEELPLDWLAPFVPELEALPHLLIFLTKRVTRAHAFFKGLGYVPRNFMVMTTVTDQVTAARLRILREVPAPLRGVSIEPLMGHVNLLPYLQPFPDGRPALDWAIIGGGSHMQPLMRADWAAVVISQLEDAGVPVFFKQWGDLRANPDPRDPTARENGGSSKGGRLWRGRELNGMPDLKRVLAAAGGGR